MFSIRTLTTKLRTSTVLDNRVVMMLTQQKEMKQKKRLKIAAGAMPLLQQISRVPT